MNADDLKEIRTKLELTQENMARKLGVTFNTYSRWERGLSKPSPLAREKIENIRANEVPRV